MGRRPKPVCVCVSLAGLGKAVGLMLVSGDVVVGHGHGVLPHSCGRRLVSGLGQFKRVQHAPARQVACCPHAYAVSEARLMHGVAAQVLP
jgi:hypothetical protein